MTCKSKWIVMILGVNLGYHSKKLYPLINDQYNVRRDEAFRFAFGSFIENVWFVLVYRQTKANMLTLMLHETILIIWFSYFSLSEINKFMYWQFTLLFVYKQERSNHTFSMNESNDEKKATSGRAVLTRTTRKDKHWKYRPINEMRNALNLNQ